MTPSPQPPGDFPTYPAGLRLAGRLVLVVGGGNVAQRRVPTFIAAGADILLVSPEVTPAIEGLVGSGEVTWAPRNFEDTDLDGAWYVMAATDDSEVNQRISVLADEQRIFCVRADDAYAATAFTPAVGTHDGVTDAGCGPRAFVTRSWPASARVLSPPATTPIALPAWCSWGEARATPSSSRWPAARR